MPFATYNTTCVRGETFRRTVTFLDPADGVTPINLTGSAFEMQWRPSLGSATVTLTATPYLTTPTPSNGELLIAVPPAVTAAIAAGRYVYDLKWTDSAGVVTVPLAGTVEMLREVTA